MAVTEQVTEVGREQVSVPSPEMIEAAPAFNDDISRIMQAVRFDSAIRFIGNRPLLSD
jgi:hypothetical protein